MDLKSILIEILALFSMTLSLWYSVFISSVAALRTPACRCLDDNQLPANFAAFVSVLPLIGAGIGHWRAANVTVPPDTLNEMLLVGNPWKSLTEELVNKSNLAMPVAAITCFLAAAAVLAACLLRRRRAQPIAHEPVADFLMSAKSLLFTFGIIAVADIILRNAAIALPQAVGTIGIVGAFFTILTFAAVNFELVGFNLRIPALAVLIGLALTSSAFVLNDNHQIRTTACVTGCLDDAPDAARAFRSWLAQRSADFEKFKEGYPVYIVAAQGGGAYAAYQTSVFLARMQDSIPAFRDHLFALSTVSGGSIGAATFLAAVREMDRSKGVNPQGALETTMHRVLSRDLLAPLIGATLFPDFTQRFLPYGIAQFDRARALEDTLDDALAQAFKQKKSFLSEGFLSQWSPQTNVPALILNATDAGSGRRFVFSPFKLSGAGRVHQTILEFPFWDTGVETWTRSTPPVDVPLATAAFVSARFPWITPAATVSIGSGKEALKIRLVDGGYVDNSGVETALDLMQTLRATADEAIPLKKNTPFPRVNFRLVVLTGGDYPRRGWFGLGEMLEPIRALLSTRATRAFVAIDRAERDAALKPRIFTADPDFPDLPPDTKVSLSDVSKASLADNFYTLPLGWTLGALTQQIIEKQSGVAGNCIPDQNFNQTVRSESNADCVQWVIGHELARSLGDAARDAAIRSARLPKDFTDVPPGVDAETNEFIACIDKRLTFNQYLRIRSLLQGLNRDAGRTLAYRDFRLLAYILGTALFETSGMKTMEEPGTPEALESRYGSSTHIGQVLGNKQPGDGYRFRGRGFIGITGRENYRLVGNKIGVDLEAFPDLLLKPEVDARAVFTFFTAGPSAPHFLKAFANESIDWATARKVVNGGTRGQDAVRSLTEEILRCKQDVASGLPKPSQGSVLQQLQKLASRFEAWLSSSVRP